MKLHDRDKGARGRRAKSAPCRLQIDYETKRFRRQWSPQDVLHRRAIAAQRQHELAALLGLDVDLAKAEAAHCKRAERAGIRKLQRAKHARRVRRQQEKSRRPTHRSCSSKLDAAASFPASSRRAVIPNPGCEHAR